jgi:hypothetical protein
LEFWEKALKLLYMMASKEEDLEAASPTSEGEGLLPPGTQDLSWEQEKTQLDSKRHSTRRNRWTIAIGIIVLISVFIIGFLFVKKPFKSPRVQEPEHIICKHHFPPHSLPK